MVDEVTVEFPEVVSYTGFDWLTIEANVTPLGPELVLDPGFLLDAAGADPKRWATGSAGEVTGNGFATIPNDGTASILLTSLNNPALLDSTVTYEIYVDVFSQGTSALDIWWNDADQYTLSPAWAGTGTYQLIPNASINSPIFSSIVFYYFSGDAVDLVLNSLSIKLPGVAEKTFTPSAVTPSPTSTPVFTGTWAPALVADDVVTASYESLGNDLTDLQGLRLKSFTQPVQYCLPAPVYNGPLVFPNATTGATYTYDITGLFTGELIDTYTLESGDLTGSGITFANGIFSSSNVLASADITGLSISATNATGKSNISETATLVAVTCSQIIAPETQVWLKGDGDTVDSIVDYSGNNLDAVAGASITYAQMTARTGWFSSIATATANGGAEHPVDSLNYNYVTGETLIMGFWLNQLWTADTDVIMGQAANTTSRRGIRVLSNSGGVVLNLYSEASIHAMQAGTVQDADGNDNHIVIAIDGVTGLGYKWLNGVPNGDSLTFTNLPATTDTLPNARTFNFGNSNNAETVVTQFKDFRFLVLAPSAGLPMNIQAIVDKMMNFPDCPITPTDLL